MKNKNNTSKILTLRAELYKKIRDYFYQYNVTEVDAPILSPYATVDPHIDSLSAKVLGETYYLHTSPEFYLKRLLAENSGDIYSLGKVFRQGEKGRRHHPEFTMLEWYRLAWDEFKLMDEVETLLKIFIPDLIVEKYSYRECFLKYIHIDPHLATLNELKALTHSLIDIDFDADEKSLWLDLLMTHCVEPVLPKSLVFIYDYPKEQAALAQLDKDKQGQLVARRFEAYVNGLELANGYFELSDYKEQEKRFKQDQLYRNKNSLPDYPYDQKLIEALKSGMPSCAGVALGVDRLLMILADTNDINDVILFS